MAEPTIDRSPKKYPPTISSILGGESKITHVGEEGFQQDRVIFGRTHPGRAHQYEVTLPDATKPGEMRTTYLTSWSPLPLSEQYSRRPEHQLFIATGQGDMPLTDDPEVIEGVLGEIGRQMEEQRRAAEADESPQS